MLHDDGESGKSNGKRNEKYAGDFWLFPCESDNSQNNKGRNRMDKETAEFF